ncbi:MAG: LysM peptidoglycan-binding domain-containing protein [Candidatus Moraniibacteriota bacterium]|nr:MAG: LysM peptidoglycan-binding domain-containing protein [Candidatus Moranbacteria bacterium]
MKSDSSMGFWSFVLSALILAPGLGVGISRATGFANTASAASAAAQAQAASAPQPTASRPAATVALALAAKSDDEEVETYEVKRGDTLTKVFGKHAGAVCKFNHLRNCNQIEPKQVLKLPEGVTPREVRVVKSEVAESLKSAKAKVTKRPMRAAKPVQEESCLKLGTAPFNRYGDMKLRLQGIDLSPVLSDAEKAEAKALVQAGRGERMLVTSDMVFEAMPFRSKDGQVKFVKNAKVCTPEQGGRPEVLEVWKLSTGKLVADPTSCGNIGPVLMTPRPEPPLVMETPPETVVNPPTIEVPAPVLTPEPPAPQLAPNPPVAAAPRGMCDFVDVAGALGQHHVPRQNGDKASSDVLTLVLDCQQRKEDETGSWGIGFKLNYAAFDGTTHRGAGRYDGRNHLAQLSYREINDDGTDWGVGVGVGKQREEYRQAALAQQARYNLVGVT